MDQLRSRNFLYVLITFEIICTIALRVSLAVVINHEDSLGLKSTSKNLNWKDPPLTNVVKRHGLNAIHELSNKENHDHTKSKNIFRAIKPRLISNLEETSSIQQMEEMYSGISTTFASYAASKLSENPDENLDIVELENELRKAGYASFLEDKSRGHFSRWMKEQWNKAKNLAKQSYKKLKEIASQHGHAFKERLEAFIKAELTPSTKKILKEMAADKLPFVEKSVADAVSHLKPILQSAIIQTLLSVFNKLESYLDIDVPDSIFDEESLRSRYYERNKDNEATDTATDSESEVPDIQKDISRHMDTPEFEEAINKLSEDFDDNNEDLKEEDEAPEEVKEKWRDALDEIGLEEESTGL